MALVTPKDAHTSKPFFKTRDRYLHAVETNDLTALKLLQKRCYSFDKSQSERLIRAAAEYGNLEIIKFLRRHGCRWDAYAPHRAVQFGQLEALKWLIENGCPWNDKWTLYCAAYHGQLDILKWIHSLNKYPLDNGLLKHALSGGNLNVVKWIVEHFHEWSPVAVLNECICHGHLHILKYFDDPNLKTQTRLFEIKDYNPYLMNALFYRRWNIATYLINRKPRLPRKLTNSLGNFFFDPSLDTKWFTCVKQLIRWSLFDNEHKVKHWIESVDVICDELCYKDLSNLIKSFI